MQSKTKMIKKGKETEQKREIKDEISLPEKVSNSFCFAKRFSFPSQIEKMELQMLMPVMTTTIMAMKVERREKRFYVYKSSE